MYYRIVDWLSGFAYTVASGGDCVQCAGDFFELHRDIGQFLFLYNTDGSDIMDVEIQLFGYVLYHGSFAMDWEEHYIPALNL